MTLGSQEGNEMVGAGAVALGETLKVNSSLQTLMLVRVLIFILICF